MQNGTVKPGIILTTSGPGVTNLITPLQDAYSDGIPLIAITGQVPTFAIGTDAFQECNAVQLTKPCTKWSYQMTTNDCLFTTLQKAWDCALDGRPGPVHIDIPKDVDSSTNSSMNSSTNSSTTLVRSVSGIPQSFKVDAISTLIQNSKRPVIIAGRGASYKVNELANKFQIPVTTTIHGLGSFNEMSSLSLKMVGMHGSAYANKAIQESDLVIGLGCRYDDRITGLLNEYAPDASLVHVDFDSGQLQKVKNLFSPRKVISIHADCESFITNLLDYDLTPDTSQWLNQIREWKNKFPLTYEQTGKLKVQEVICKLDKYLNARRMNNTLFTTGVGNHQMFTAQFITWRKKALMTSGSLGVMGVGLPYAIGTQLANPQSNTVLIDGDGSFNMTLNDLATVRDLNLPIKIFIMNDSRMQMVHVWQDLFFQQRYIGTKQWNPDYCKIAEAHNISSLSCTKSEEVTLSIHEAFEEKGPFLINFKVEPDYCFPLVGPGKSLGDMMLSRGKHEFKNVLPPS